MLKNKLSELLDEAKCKVKSVWDKAKEHPTEIAIAVAAAGMACVGGVLLYEHNKVAKMAEEIENQEAMINLLGGAFRSDRFFGFEGNSERVATIESVNGTLIGPAEAYACADKAARLGLDEYVFSHDHTDEIKVTFKDKPDEVILKGDAWTANIKDVMENEI